MHNYIYDLVFRFRNRNDFIIRIFSDFKLHRKIQKFILWDTRADAIYLSGGLLNE